MPYNPVTGIYTLPPIYLAVPGTVIIAAQHNDPLVDLQTANNYARPVIAGGTGANTASSARTNLAVPGLAGVNTYTGQQQWAKGADIASAATLTIGNDGNYFHVTGTITITAISTAPAGTLISLEFDAALQLTHSAALILPNNSNVTTVAGVTAVFVSEGSGNWRALFIGGILNYATGSTSPTVTSSSGSFSSVSCSLNYTRVGNRCFWGARVIIGAAGTATGVLNIPLPFTVAVQTSCYGNETVTTVACTGTLAASAATAAVTRYDGAGIIATGRTVLVDGNFIIA